MAVTRRVLLVDGTNLLMRSIKALEHGVGSPMSVGDVNTGPTYVFINSLSKYVRDEEPDRLVVFWDGGRSTFRTEIYDGYKGERAPRSPEEEDEVQSHFALAKEFLSLAGVHHVREPGVEADDLIAAVWRKRDPDWRVTILSGDKDFLQLLDGWTEQIRPGAPIERWTANRVRTEMKCKPEHLPLIMAITGDAIDGVPGVAGFGHKTACKYLGKYDWDLEALLAAERAGKEFRLEGMTEHVRRNLRLVDLRSEGADVHVSPPPHFEPTTPDTVLWDDLMAWLDRYEMHTVAQRLEAGGLWTEQHRLKVDSLPPSVSSA